MKKNRKIKKLITCLSFGFMIILSAPSYAFANARGGNIEARADQYRWVYATIDGVDYKRLFNESTGEWVTDWIKV